MINWPRIVRFSFGSLCFALFLYIFTVLVFWANAL